MPQYILKDWVLIFEMGERKFAATANNYFIEKFKVAQYTEFSQQTL